MTRKTYPEAIAHYPKSQQAIIKRIFNRVDSGKNALIAVTGATGSGKSYAVLSLQIGLYLYQKGELPSLDYTKLHCLFKAKDFLQEMMRKDLKPMECWMYDESGVDINSKNHATNYNKVMNFLVQTFRHLQQVVFFTLPSFSFLDKSIRKMIHYKMETVKINKSKKMNKCKFFRLQYNERQDKVYFHRIKTQKGKYSAFLSGVNTLLPPTEFWKQYEEQKEEFNTAYKQKLMNILEVVEQKENRETLSTRELTDKQKIMWNCILENETDRETIRAKAGWSDVSEVSKNARYMKNKGYNVPRLGKPPGKPKNEGCGVASITT